MKEYSRRDFIKTGITAAAGAAAFTIVPSHVLGKTLGHVAPSDKLNIAGVGIGGVGRRNLKNMATENIVALCDVDWSYAMKTFNDYPSAKRFKDWRVMFDQMGKDIDAVVVATPDHTHAVVAAHAMTLGKHVYVQKPLTHSVYEARLLTKLAKKYKVATQMGNQGNSFDDCRQLAEWIWSGVIGDVYEVHCWTDRPIWPQGLMKPAGGVKVPKTLDWDLFIGPAETRPYDPAYTPWNWRGFYDFGTGALGDMACHIMDPIVMALGIKYPTSVQASSTLSNLYSPPHAETITYTFPAREPKGNVKMPELKVVWYDGGLLPPRPEELPDGEMMGDSNGGLLFIGTKGKIMAGCYGLKPAQVLDELFQGAGACHQESPRRRHRQHMGQRPRAGLDQGLQGIPREPCRDFIELPGFRTFHRDGGCRCVGCEALRAYRTSPGAAMGRREHALHEYLRIRHDQDSQLRRIQGH